MYLSKAQRADKAFMDQTKSWLANVSLSVKEGRAPAFEVSGPMELPCRVRPRLTVENHAFMGGEEFTLSQVFRESDPSTGGENIRVMLVPKDPESARVVAGVTLPLEEATNAFDGLEAWLFDPSRWSTDLSAQKKANKGGNDHLPSADEVRNSEALGGW